MATATVKDVIHDVYTKVNGEYEDLDVTSDDFRTYLNVLNQVVTQWVEMPYISWQSLFNMNFTLGHVVKNTLMYSLPVEDSNFVIGHTPFDSVYFVDNSGKIVDKFTMVNQPIFDASSDDHICMTTGDTLVLKTTPDTIVGMTIKLPVYEYPQKYTKPNDEVRIDSLAWLTCEMAGFLCDSSPVPFISRNADKYHKQAEIYMKRMRDENNHAQHIVLTRIGAGRGELWRDVIAKLTWRDL